MKPHRLLPRLALLAVVPFLVDCSTTGTPSQAASTAPAASAPKPIGTKVADAKTDELDDYDTVEVADPLQPFNRGMFKVNDVLYTALFRPISKGYEFILPKPVRKGIDNAFENVKYPVRFVNCALQGKFKRAGQETGKFVVNTVGGVGGVFQTAERIPSLANVPAEDFGQTLATWKIGHGPYIVLPLFGPSSVRETVGLVGDYAANPVNWPYLYWKTGDWDMVPPSANTLRSLPGQLETYDSVTKDAVDPYISARSFYIQNRAAEARK